MAILQCFWSVVTDGELQVEVKLYYNTLHGPQRKHQRLIKDVKYSSRSLLEFPVLYLPWRHIHDLMEPRKNVYEHEN